jgi:hypothetical protein
VTFEDLTKSFDALLNNLLEWFDVCRHPLTHCDAMLALRSDREKISKSLRLWLVIFLMTLTLQLPLLKIAGIEWSDAGFHLPYFLALTIAFVLNGVSLHLGMRIYGIQSNIADTLGAYTTLVGVYGPLVTLVSYPKFVPLFASLKSAKSQGLPFISAMSFMLKNHLAASRTVDLEGVLLSVLALPAGAGVLAALTVMARKLSIRYSAPKARTLASFGFSFSVLTLPALLGLGLFAYFTAYAFIKP